MALNGLSFGKLRHEHIVPKNVVIQMLLNLQSPTAGQVLEICERYLIGVVVTIEEDAVLSAIYSRKMPEKFIQY
jgi:hypothetical protein